MESDRERERAGDMKEKKRENRNQAEDDGPGGILLLFWGQIRNGVLLLSLEEKRRGKESEKRADRNMERTAERPGKDAFFPGCVVM